MTDLILRGVRFALFLAVRLQIILYLLLVLTLVLRHANLDSVPGLFYA
jgi:hypothetical protein